MNGLVLKVLILGGTHFLGPAFITCLHSRGHEITLFNRQTEDPASFPFCDHLKGDRNEDLTALEGKKWDVVIDTSGFFPEQVKASASLLSKATSLYLFISSISVYQSFQTKGIDENSPLCTPQFTPAHEITDANYGPLKVACEMTVKQFFPSNYLIVRPGILVGPRDRTNRFTYWPRCILEQDEVIAPDKPSLALQFLDVRDLAYWVVDMAERKEVGTYNATGPILSFGNFLEACQQFAGKDRQIYWLDEDFLLQNGVKDWERLPLWFHTLRGRQGFFTIDSGKAYAKGLKTRPIQETITDAIAEKNNNEDDYLKGAEYQQILALWKQREK